MASANNVVTTTSESFVPIYAEMLVEIARLCASPISTRLARPCNSGHETEHPTRRGERSRNTDLSSPSWNLVRTRLILVPFTWHFAQASRRRDDLSLFSGRITVSALQYTAVIPCEIRSHTRPWRKLPGCGGSPSTLRYEYRC